MQVVFGGTARTRLAEWQGRCAGLERSALEVWSRPIQVAAGIYAIGVAALVIGHVFEGQEALLANSALLAVVLGLALAGRLATPGIDVHGLAKEISQRNARSFERLTSAVEGLPEIFRREIRAEGRRVYQGAEGHTLVAVTGLVVMAAALAMAPGFAVARSVAPSLPLAGPIGALIVGAIVLPALVRLLVATSAEVVRVRTTLLEELAAIIEDSWQPLATG